MDRFWDKVKDGPGCWEWQGAIRPDGYGVIKVDGKTIQAHRMSYQITDGDIPEGKLILHRCDNRRCVKPDHLFLGSHKDNSQDMVSKKRNVPRAKITQEIVDEARKIYEAGGVTLATLAEKYGVTRQAMGNAVRGRSW